MLTTPTMLLTTRIRHALSFKCQTQTFQIIRTSCILILINTKLVLYFLILSNIIMILSHNNFHLSCPVLHYLDCSVAGALAAEVREAVESKIETYHHYSLCFHLVTTCNRFTFLTSHQHSSGTLNQLQHTYFPVKREKTQETSSEQRSFK